MTRGSVVVRSDIGKADGKADNASNRYMLRI